MTVIFVVAFVCLLFPRSLSLTVPLQPQLSRTDRARGLASSLRAAHPSAKTFAEALKAEANLVAARAAISETDPAQSSRSESSLPAETTTTTADFLPFKRPSLRSFSSSSSSSSFNLGNEQDINYIGFASFGTPPQVVPAVFDTGSSAVFVVDKSCDVSACGSHPYGFSNTDSTTYKPTGQDQLLEYGSGSTSGPVARDVIGIGQGLPGLSTSMPFVYGEVLTGTIKSDHNTSALVGMAWPAVSFDLDGSPVPPIMMALADAGKVTKNAFSFYLSELGASTPSLMTVGDYNETLFGSSPLVTVPLTRKDYWAIRVDKLFLDNDEVGCSRYQGSQAPCMGIIDSGTSFLAVNSMIFDGIESAAGDVSGSSCAKTSNGLIFCTPCTEKVIKQFPDMSIIVTDKGGRKVTLTLTPQDYIETFPDEEGGSICLLEIMLSPLPGAYANGMILGDTFMRRYYSVFSYDDSSMSFGEVAGGAPKKPFSGQTGSLSGTSITIIILSVAVCVAAVAGAFFILNRRRRPAVFMPFVGVPAAPINGAPLNYPAQAPMANPVYRQPVVIAVAPVTSAAPAQQQVQGDSYVRLADDNTTH